MHTDAATLAGRMHLRSAEPSEDYACSGQVGDALAYAIVSDGCSGGGETDLGSRLLAVSFARLLEREPSAAPQWIAAPAALEADLLAELDRVGWWGLSFADTTATLVSVIAAKEGERPPTLLGVLSGDGALVLRYPDESFDVVEQSNTLNAPHYLNYHRGTEVLQRYIASQKLEGGMTELYLTRIDHLGAVRERTLLVSTAPDATRAGRALRVLDLAPFRSMDAGDAPAVVMALTDGFSSRRGHQASATLAELLDFKGFAGKFLRRQLGAAQSRWLRQDSVPQDDLSIAGIHLGTVDTIDALVAAAPVVSSGSPA